VVNSATEFNNSDGGIVTVEENGTISAEGDVNNLAGSTIQVDGLISLEGDWTNDGTASLSLAGATMGTVEFSGSANQDIGGSVATTFEDFTIDKLFGIVSILNNTTITGKLTLTSGIIETGASTLICTSNLASDITGYNANGFIYGNLRKSITTNTDNYALPVGSANNSSGYHLAMFVNNNLTGVSALNVSVASVTEAGNNIDANLDPAKAIEDGTLLSDVLSDAEWSIEPVGAVSGGSFGVRLYVANISGISASEDNEFTVVKRPSASTSYADWDAFDATTAIPVGGAPGRIFGGGAGYALKTGFTTFSRFAIIKSINEPLPIEMLSFTGVLNDGNVDLFWTTFSEINNDYFTVERAGINETSNLLQWEFVETVDGAGTSNFKIDYSTRDISPKSGISYYRLKQTDFDGNSSFSEPIAINNTNNGIGTSNFLVYPNPSFNQVINIVGIKSYSPNELLYISVTDIMGRTVISMKILTDDIGFFSTAINRNNELVAGVYLIDIMPLFGDHHTTPTNKSRIIVK
ncbi:MAG: T9SS type A sorting domain-containing protein, partial [Bacteroidetes bacterium]|nr:T9SS type A sorting domain-containing protein [Bacteroidota bacterium]